MIGPFLKAIQKIEYELNQHHLFKANPVGNNEFKSELELF